MSEIGDSHDSDFPYPSSDHTSLTPDHDETCHPLDTDVPSLALGLLDPELSEARRHQLDVINRLHNLGAQLDIDIPQIVVIGSQSAGKSSLIESISGIRLPRSSGTCTRCPTECRLIHSTKPWECTVSLRFMTGNSGRPLRSVRNVPFGPPIRDPIDVEERIRRAQRAALNPLVDPQLFLASDQPYHDNALDFTTNSVSLEIRGPEVTDLSFCDLPGLIASVSDPDRDDDIEKVKQMVSSYISKPSCIILLTVACESDFETQGAYTLAKQHDKSGTRTIGVLTKPDRIPDGEEDRWIRLIRNDISPLENGWYCVKQPSSVELEKNLTFHEARRRGEAFFTNQPWSLLELSHRRRLGTRALTQKLNEYLMSLIAKRFPELMQELQKVLQRTKDELKRLPVPVSGDPLMELLHLVGDFSDDLFRHSEGITYNIGEPVRTGDNHFERIRDAHECFRQSIKATAPAFHPFDRPPPLPIAPTNFERTAPSHPESYLPSRRPSVCSMRTHRPYPDPASEQGYPEPATPHPSIPSSPLAEFCDLAGDVTENALDPVYLNDVVQKVKRATTRELPGYFPFRVIQDFITSSTNQWMEPATSLVESIYTIVFEHHKMLIDKHFGKFTAGGLRQAVLKIVQEFMDKRREEVLRRVEWLLELEAHVFTLNKHYLDDYREKFLARYKEERQQHFGRHVRLPAPEPWNPDQYGLEIMATVRAYFQVAYKRIVDTLPLAIDRELVRVQKRHVQEAVSSGLDIIGPETHERCAKLLSEPSELIERREELRNRLERLVQAQRELVAA
ncbi:hypothetical protein K439DRAFT_1652711 [Ramaria rubella]|nr:hypothetical protein K439DRAFT_1652711 [Ramaria rubella]